MGSLTGAETSIALRVARVLLIAAGLAGWFWTQRILAARAFPAGGISDRIHEWTGPWNRYLREHPSAGPAWGRLGMVLHAHVFADEAQACYAEAARLDPADPRWPYLEANIQLSRVPDAAVPGLRRAAEQPSWDDAAERLLRAYHTAHRTSPNNGRSTR